MKLLRTIDLVLARFGNIKAMERTHVDDFTENKINSIQGILIADSDQGELFVAFQELAGYEFLVLTVLSSFDIKTIKGAQLHFYNPDIEGAILELDSDTREIEADYSNVSNRFITKIDFILSQEDIQFILKPEATQVNLLFKKNKYSFKILKEAIIEQLHDLTS